MHQSTCCQTLVEKVTKNWQIIKSPARIFQNALAVRVSCNGRRTVADLAAARGLQGVELPPAFEQVAHPGTNVINILCS